MVVKGSRGLNVARDRCLATGAEGAKRQWHRGFRMVLAAALVVHGAGVFAQSLEAQQAASGVQAAPAVTQKLPALNSSNAASSRAGSSASNADVAPPAGPDTSSANGGNVAELQRRIAGKELAELRTVYNGSYGASLLMATNDPTYYIALFERKNFWRVIKTQNDARAEAVFEDFAQQTASLADTEIRGVKLAAQRSATERLISLNKDRALQIQADLAVQQSQQQAVSERQRLAQAQAATLANENRKAQDQLADLRRQLDDLQKQQNAGLPPTPSSTKRRR